MIVVVDFWAPYEGLQKALRRILEPGDRLVTVLRGELEDDGDKFGHPCQAIIERRMEP